MNTSTQCDQLLRYLAQGFTITPLEALEKFGVMALSQRMTDLRKRRWPIESEMIKLKNGKRCAMYSIPAARQKPIDIGEVA